MAKIEFKNVRHAYPAPSDQAPVYALEQVDQVWEDGGAYALLGPSGCGKTTLLNIISGLLTPSEGAVYFDDEEVTHLPTTERHIAQVFQFPVVYDTMTVYDNLAFPLRNRQVPEDQVRKRVEAIAEMLDLTNSLKNRASGLTADGKQKISLGRGLVRPDVKIIMFDEPLTVIDPHLKWLLRSKLKELHQQLGVTMIYVTHDQTEALTFADKVLVMLEGTIVQVGTPVELFMEPNHTFVGHFIGSPGMNVLPCEVKNGQVSYRSHLLETAHSHKQEMEGKLEIGVRPEFVRFDDAGIPVSIERIEDLGRFKIATVAHEGDVIKLLVPDEVKIPENSPKIMFDPERTHLYCNNWVVK
ncbi:MAG: ABC transporter ATP-binding protein [SAR324 cluster bacterium]|nr:ABC transporter ATP-binding protein [SAR324 cluster bacterium]